MIRARLYNKVRVAVVLVSEDMHADITRCTSVEGKPMHEMEARGNFMQLLQLQLYKQDRVGIPTDTEDVENPIDQLPRVHFWTSFESYTLEPKILPQLPRMPLNTRKGQLDLILFLSPHRLTTIHHQSPPLSRAATREETLHPLGE